MKDKFYIFFKFVSEYALYGLLFFIPISISLVEIFIGLLLFGFIGRKIIKPDFKFIRFLPNVFLFAFLFFSALSLLNSGQYIDKSVHALFGKWVQYLSICVIVQDCVYDQKIIKRGILVFLSSASIVVISGLSQYFFGVEFLRNRGVVVIDDGIRAITSSFAHYNSLGGYLVVVLSLILALLLQDDTFKPKIFGLLAFSVITVIAIALTFSRGSWLALAVSFIFVSIFGGKNSRRFVPAFLTIIAMFLLLPIFCDRMFSIFSFGADKDRAKYWLAAFKMIGAHPFFGIGVGKFMTDFPKYIPNLRVSYAHNCYLQIWAEVGFFGLASFIAFIISIFYLWIEKMFGQRDFLLLGLFTGVTGFLVHSFFDNNLYSLQLAVLFWVWTGLITARLRVSK